MGQPHCQLFALCRYRLFPDRAEQYVCHHPHESIRTNLTLLSAHHGLPRHAPALCGRRRCCNLSHFALFPVQKLSAASSCRLSVPFVCFAERRQCGVSSADVLHPHLADGASGFQSLTFRSFCGAIIGWSIPYWFLLGHAFFHNEIELFYQPFIHLADFRDIDFGRDFQLWEVVTLGYLFILYIVSSIHCIVAGYEDKIRTRAYLHFLIFLNFCIFLFIVLQPALSMNLLSLLLIGISILVGHLFVLTNSKSSNLFFIGSMITLIALFCFNIWTLL